jgi:hypothetical protein
MAPLANERTTESVKHALVQELLTTGSANSTVMHMERVSLDRLQRYVLSRVSIHRRSSGIARNMIAPIVVQMTADDCSQDVSERLQALLKMALPGTPSL